MKIDALLQRNVQDALNYEPTIMAGEIGVIVMDGIVTLTGTVDSYSKKLQAEKTARRVKGVKAVVEKIQVRLSKSAFKSDLDLAAEIVEALQGDYSVPRESISVKVEDGYVTLEGSVLWDYQRKSAYRNVARIIGVKGVHNKLSLHSAGKDVLEKEAVERAISRHWSLDPNTIFVNVTNNEVSLSGYVDSLYQKDEAERLAWQAPGVQHVENHLTVEHKLRAINV
ncbi:MAG: BON domain-containing protein [Flavobacterium sp.]|nr:MAG: BON domain-containing protein [Flavobacterium sp.]